METWKESEILYEGKVVRLRVGQVTLDNGETAVREVVEHPGGVCIAPFTGHSVLFVRQFRIALGKYILEAPAGKIEEAEEPAFRAARELEEETGYRAGKLISVGGVYSSVGFCSEKIHLYLALGLEYVGQCLDLEERIELVELPMDEIRRSLRENTFEDGKTILVLRALIDYLDGGNPA